MWVMEESDMMMLKKCTYIGIMTTQNTYGRPRPKYRSDKKIVPKGTQGQAVKAVKALRGWENQGHSSCVSLSSDTLSDK